MSERSGLSIRFRFLRFFNPNSPFGIEVKSQSRKKIVSRLTSEDDSKSELEIYLPLKLNDFKLVNWSKSFGSEDL